MPLPCPRCGRPLDTENADPSGRITCDSCGFVMRIEDASILDPTAAAKSENVIGRVIAGCRIDAELGRGAMGGVYLARHQRLDTPVAIKILRHSVVDEEDPTVQRFVREARSAARLRHPHIVAVFDVGEDAGYHFIIMEYMEGGTLQELLNRHGRLPAPLALRLMAEVASALEFARECGVIHRDIKPDNLMLNNQGVCKIADFGLAKSIISDIKLTQTSMLLGTPYYMAPEQAASNDAVDHRSDLYALGCTFFHLLSGQLPFDGATVYTILSQHVSAPPPNLVRLVPDAPPELAQIILRLMAKRPEDRFQTAGELLRELTDLNARLSAPAHSASDSAVLAYAAVPPPATPLPLPAQAPAMTGMTSSVPTPTSYPTPLGAVSRWSYPATPSPSAVPGGAPPYTLPPAQPPPPPAATYPTVHPAAYAQPAAVPPATVHPGHAVPPPTVYSFPSGMYAAPSPQPHPYVPEPPPPVGYVPPSADQVQDLHIFNARQKKGAGPSKSALETLSEQVAESRKDEDEENRLQHRKLLLKLIVLAVLLPIIILAAERIGFFSWIARGFVGSNTRDAPTRIEQTTHQIDPFDPSLNPGSGGGSPGNRSGNRWPGSSQPQPSTSPSRGDGPVRNPPPTSRTGDNTPPASASETGVFTTATLSRPISGGGGVPSVERMAEIRRWISSDQRERAEADIHRWLTEPALVEENRSVTAAMPIKPPSDPAERQAIYDERIREAQAKVTEALRTDTLPPWWQARQSALVALSTGVPDAGNTAGNIVLMADPQVRRRVYFNALQHARNAINRAQRQNDPAAWGVARELLEKAVATNHTDVSAAVNLLRTLPGAGLSTPSRRY